MFKKALRNVQHGKTRQHARTTTKGNLSRKEFELRRAVITSKAVLATIAKITLI